MEIIIDLILSGFYSILIIVFSILLKSSKNNNSRYLPLAVSFKILCTYIFCFTYIFYFKGGDTFFYFKGAQFLRSIIIEEPYQLFSFFFLDYQDILNIPLEHQYAYKTFTDHATFLLAKLATIPALVSFNQFISTTLLFSLFWFIGIWKAFTAIAKNYPQYTKEIAICFLFIPSVVVWGSGILKDTVVVGSIGWCISSFYNLFFARKKIILNLIIFVSAIYFCLSLKPYVLYTFVPGLLLWLYVEKKKLIKHPIIKVIALPLIIVLMLASGYGFITFLSDSAGKYSLENIEDMVQGFQSWHTYLANTRDQSGYTLGNDVDFTLTGMLAKAPAALNVTYFRPYLTEVRNPMMLLAALESTVVLIFFIYVLFKAPIWKWWGIMRQNPILALCFFFSITFGFAVGFTSYNFGALSRYKIPCMPFFLLALCILLYHKRKNTIQAIS